jgi:hypothetical protein
MPSMCIEESRCRMAKKNLTDYIEANALLEAIAGDDDSEIERHVDKLHIHSLTGLIAACETLIDVCIKVRKEKRYKHD